MGHPVTVKRVADPGRGCVGDCGLCPDCLHRLPIPLVELMVRSKGTVPAVYETTVKCAGMWLRAHRNGVPTRRRLKRAG
jgi:hypothetical protein